MPDPRQLDPDRIRVVLDHGDVVKLDGGTLVLDGEESLSVVLRLAPWRARSVAGCCRSGRRYHGSSTTRPSHISTSWTCHGCWSWLLRSSVTAIRRSPRGSRVIPNRRRLAAVAILGEREAHLSAVQRLALIDAAAWWLSEPNGGEEFAYALLAASCAAEITTEHVYLA
jgi:ribosomal protein L34E